MNPGLGLAFGGIVGMAAFTALFAAGGWWLLALPLGFVAMVFAIGIGSRL